MSAIPTRGKTNHNVIIPDIVRTMQLNVGPGDVITWETGNYTVTLIFPTADLFGEINYLILPNSQLSLTVSPDAVPGAYPYAIYNHSTSKLDGDGDQPEIIIT